MLTDSRSPANTKQEKFIGNHAQTHQIQTFGKTKDKEKNVKAARHGEK